MWHPRVKALAKRFVPRDWIYNLQGLLKALRTYYPQYLLGSDALVFSLQEIHIEVTMRCSCRCKMCPLFGTQADGGKQLMEKARRDRELDLADFEALFDQLVDLGSPFVHFTGGEVFLRKDMMAIVAAARARDLRCSLITSGGLVTPAIARELVELGVESVLLSVDGPKELHEKIRNSRNFDSIMEAVDSIASERRRQHREKPSMSFLCTMSALNQQQLAPMVEIANQKQVSIAFGPTIYSTQEGWDSTLAAFNHSFIKIESLVMPEETIGVDVWALESEIARVESEARRLDQDVYFMLGTRKARERFWREPDYAMVDKCLAPWFSTRIDPYGNVYQCSISTRLGNVLEQSLVEIWNGTRYQEFRRKTRDEGPFPVCNKCPVTYSRNWYWNLLPRRIPFWRPRQSDPIVEFEAVPQTHFDHARFVSEPPG